MAVFSRLSGDKTGTLVIGYSIKFGGGTPTKAKIVVPAFIHLSARRQYKGISNSYRIKFTAGTLTEAKNEVN